MTRRTSIDTATLCWLAADALDWNDSAQESTPELNTEALRRVAICKRILKRYTAPGPIAQALERSRSVGITELMKRPDQPLKFPGSS